MPLVFVPAAGGVLDRSLKGLRGALFKLDGPWGVELLADNDLETVHFSISEGKKQIPN